MSELNMQVAGTEKGIEGVRQATELILQAWQSGEAETSAVGRSLGKGKMGRAFLGVYEPEANRSAQQVYWLTEGGDELVAASRKSVAEYQQTDERIRAEFERQLSPELLQTRGR